MSYDIFLTDPATQKTVVLPFKLPLRGGTHRVDGNDLAEFNITYNYAPILRKVLPPEGIRTLYGMTAYDSIPLLNTAIQQLADDYDDDYWKCTEGNVKIALANCLSLAALAPANSIWDGD